MKVDTPHYHWSQKRILIVEDDESSAYLLGELLKDTGAIIDFTTGGEEAVEYIRQHPDTDLVLMDIHLPEKDGFTATREIKAQFSKVVIFAQTGYAFSVEQLEAEEAGCDAFFTKPINTDLLLNKMNGYLT